MDWAYCYKKSHDKEHDAPAPAPLPGKLRDSSLGGSHCLFYGEMLMTEILYALLYIAACIIEIPVTLFLSYLAVRFILMPILFLPLTIEEWWTGKEQ